MQLGLSVRRVRSRDDETRTLQRRHEHIYEPATRRGNENLPQIFDRGEILTIVEGIGREDTDYALRFEVERIS